MWIASKISFFNGLERWRDSPAVISASAFPRVCWSYNIGRILNSIPVTRKKQITKIMRPLKQKITTAKNNKGNTVLCISKVSKYPSVVTQV